MSDEKEPREIAPEDQAEPQTEESAAASGMEAEAETNTAPIVDEPVVEARPELSRAQRSWAGLLGLIFAVMALAAIAGVAGLGYTQIWPQYQALLSEKQAQEQSLASLRQDLLALKKGQQQAGYQLQDFDDRLNGQLQIFSESDRRLQALLQRQDQSDANIQQLAQLVQGGQEDWQLAEIEHLLLIANDRVLLLQDVAGATLALQLADKRLAQMANPQLIAVRAAIADELTQLEAVPRVDVQALALQLGSLGEQVQRLPVRQAKLGQFEPEPVAVSETVDESWQEKLWRSASEALQSLVSIKRDAEKRTPLLPPDQEFYLRQNLRLQLESARLAVLNQDAANLNAALRQAESWLQEYFDVQDPAAQGALRSLRNLQGTSLHAAMPDISASLRSLRALQENS